MYQAKVVFTFDDGNDNLYTNALPIMRKYGLFGTAYIVTDWVGTAGKITYGQLQEMQNKGWEIGSHSVTHPDLTTLTTEVASQELVNSKSALESNSLNCYTFAPPSRKWNNDLAALAQQAGYTAVRAVSNTSAITQSYPIPNLFYIDNGTASYSTLNYGFETIKTWIDQAITEGAMVILLFHHVRDVSDAYSATISDFERICAYVKFRQQRGETDVVTFYDALTPSDKKIFPRILTPNRILSAIRNLPN